MKTLFINVPVAVIDRNPTAFEQYLVSLADVAGGFSLVDVGGGWVMKDGTLCVEAIKRVEVYVGDSDVADKVCDAMAYMVSWLKREGEEAVMVGSFDTKAAFV